MKFQEPLLSWRLRVAWLGCVIIGMSGQSLCKEPLISKQQREQQQEGATSKRITRGALEAGGVRTFTISQPGVYYLTGSKSAVDVANIAITASNVILDLDGNTLTGGTNGVEITGDNVTVKNGALTAATYNGVLVQGNGCRLEGLDVTQCTTGITLDTVNQCVVQNCLIRNVTQAGVSLQSTWTCRLQ